MYREDYLLARVEADIGRDTWFGTPLPAEPKLPGEPQGRVGFRRWRERKRLWKEYEQNMVTYSREKEELEANICQMAECVLAAVEETGAKGEIKCVYEEELKFLSEENKGISELWGRYWNIPEFREFREFRWVKPLLTEAREPYFILLGIASCIPLLLEHCARRIRSVCWYLREEDCGEEVQEFAEEFYLEYGLAMTILPLSGRNAFRCLRLKTEEPVCVLDFTEEEKIFAGELKEGSTWLDFCSVEEKKRRIRRLAPGVRYDSLMSIWKRSRRESQNKTNFTISDNSEKKPLFL